MQKVENYEHFVRKQDVTVEMIDNHTANKIVTDQVLEPSSRNRSRGNKPWNRS